MIFLAWMTFAICEGRKEEMVGGVHWDWREWILGLELRPSLSLKRQNEGQRVDEEGCLMEDGRRKGYGGRLA